MIPAAVLSTVGLLRWPFTITGAILVFGLSTNGTLSLVSSNAHRLVEPVSARTDINMPPVKQIADLTPLVVAPVSPNNDGGTAIPPTGESMTQIALRQPDIATNSELDLSSRVALPSVEPTNLRPGRIGSSAVNVRSGPSKNAAKLAVLSAGANVRLGEEDGGWIHVWYDGGEGWAYSTYLVENSAASTHVRGGDEATQPAKRKTIEINSRIAARVRPESGSVLAFRLQPGERVQIVDRRGKWLKIATVSGDMGWILTK